MWQSSSLYLQHTGVMALALAILPGKASGQKTVWSPQPERFGFKSYLVMSCFITWYLLVSLILSFLLSKFRTLGDFQHLESRVVVGAHYPLIQAHPLLPSSYNYVK